MFSRRATLNRTASSGLALMMLSVPAFAQDAPKIVSSMPKHYICTRTDTPPALDGTMSSPAWERAPWTDFFVDIEGDKKPAPTWKTRVKMLWDDEFFYIGAQMEEPQVWATLTQRDSVIFHDNDFEVFIDPDGDNHNYYELELNALNTVWDLRLPKPYRDGGNAVNEWNIKGLRTAVFIDGKLNDTKLKSRGWSVEIAMPWRALGEYALCSSPPREGDQWRVNFSRVEWDVKVENERFVKVPDRPEHNWVWSPQGRIDMHQPEQWGFVQFSHSSTAPFLPDPSIAARTFLMKLYHAQRALHDKSKHYATSWAQLGVDVPPSLFTPSIQTWADDFEASAAFKAKDGTLRRLHVRSDSLLWFSDEKG